jgi:hypothetical protein
MSDNPKLKQFISWLDSAVHEKVVEYDLTATELQFALHTLINETRSSIWGGKQ